MGAYNYVAPRVVRRPRDPERGPPSQPSRALAPLTRPAQFVKLSVRKVALRPLPPPPAAAQR